MALTPHPTIKNAWTNVSNYLQGKTVVDNEANPNSALNRRKKDIAEAAAYHGNAQTEAVRRGIERAYGPNSKVKRYGSPL